MDTVLYLNISVIVLFVINIIIILMYMIQNSKLNKLRKNYADFMTKLGKGENINEMLHNILDNVEVIKGENKEIKQYCDKLYNKANKCLNKVGLVRYNAFKDTGSNLSFSLALLDDENDGIVFNGIYSRDCSNIYCKDIKNGKSQYALSKEEQEAIDKAMNLK